MSTKDIIDKTKSPNTISSLVADFKDLGLKSGDVIIVHSSLSKIGWVVGGSVAVIEALMEAITSDGTIVMPTHTPSNSDPKDWKKPPVPKEWHDLIRENYPPFRAEISPTSGMGTIPELFRKYPDVERSNHPNVSFAAWGKYAKQITEKHDLVSNLGKGSPLKKIYDLDGQILLLGVGHDSNTSIHLAEELATYSDKKMITQSSAVMKDGERTRLTWKEIDWDSDDFDKIGEEFATSATKHNLKIGLVGKAKSLLIKQPALVDFATNWMTKYR